MQAKADKFGTVTKMLCVSGSTELVEGKVYDTTSPEYHKSGDFLRVLDETGQWRYWYAHRFVPVPSEKYVGMCPGEYSGVKDSLEEIESWVKRLPAYTQTIRVFKLCGEYETETTRKYKPL